ncbi:hypothetical protein OX90_23110, partial [Pseudomonas coronafaciens pv. porri]
ARNAHGEGGWLKELSVPRVGTVGYFCSASLGVSGAMKPYQLYRLTLGGLATAVFRPTLNKEAVKRVNRHTFFIGFLHAGCQ